MIDRGYTPEKTNLNNVLSRETVALRLGVSESLDDFPAVLWPVVDEAVERTREDFSVINNGNFSEIEFACLSFGNIMNELDRMRINQQKSELR